MNIGLCVAHHGVRHPRRVAVDHDGEHRLTYAELDQRSNRVAHLLQALGVSRGDRVSALLFNRVEIVELLVGIAKAGAIAAPMSFRLPERDVAAILETIAPRVIVTEPEFREIVELLATKVGAVVVDLDDGYEAALAAASPSSPATMLRVDGTEDALIQFTSGTTGHPKGATFTHDAVLMHAANVALEYSIDGTSRLLLALPHVGGIANCQTFPALYRGATVVSTDVRTFDAERWIADVNRLGATHTQVVPTMLYRVLEAARAQGATMPTMRRLGYGSAPMPPERVEELLHAFGNVFLQLYGMIETAAMATMLRPDEHAWALEQAPEVLGSVGQPTYSMAVRVVDDAGRDVPEGERGEVVFKGPHLMRCYWDAPELTAETIRDGWLHSGDVGEHRNGWLFIVDRMKDIIIRGGQNIASKEVEEAVYTHPAVMEAAVIGVPEAEWGEEVVAVVVLRPNMTAKAEDILRACHNHGLSRFKSPSQIRFVAELPRNTIGKVLKRELRRRFAMEPHL